MSADTRQLEFFARALARIAHRDINDIRREIILKEGQSVVTRAKLICKKEKIWDTGNLSRSFHAQNAQVFGTSASCTISNNAEYASFVEFGHLSVGGGAPNTLLSRRRNAIDGGRYVRGRYVLARAIANTLRTQNARIERRIRRMYENI